MRVRSVFAVTAAAAAVTLAAPLTAAQAAEGAFVYLNLQEGPKVIENPQPNHCHKLVESDAVPPAVRLSNETDATAAVFGTTDCSGRPETVMVPYSSTTLPGRSVVFSR